MWEFYTVTVELNSTYDDFERWGKEEEEAIQVYLRSVVDNPSWSPDTRIYNREQYESTMENIASQIRMCYPNTEAGRSELDDFNHAWRARLERTSNNFDKAEKKARLREMRKKLKRLKASGFPEYITVDYLIKNLEDKEYARLFKFLRSNGVPNQSENQYDILNDIDFYVFTGILSKEDGLFVINHSRHIELMQAKFSKKLKLNKKEAKENANYVKRLLVDEGFNEFPDSVKKVVNGGSIDAIAILDDIKRKKYSTIHDGRLQRIANIENISRKVDDESS